MSIDINIGQCTGKDTCDQRKIKEIEIDSGK